MRRVMTGLAATAFMLGIAGIAAAGPNDHNVTVTVQAINHIVVAGGNVTLTIDTAEAGQPPASVEDSATKLNWTTNAPSSAKKKVTASLDSDFSAGIALKVRVTVSGGNGTSQGQQTLTASGVTLVTGVYGEATSNNTLTYEASAAVTVPPTSETKTVTYTLVDE